MKVLVTGADGFVGRAMIEKLGADGVPIVAAVRTARSLLGVRAVEVGNIGPQTNWERALTEVDRVIHLAARVHVMREHTGDPLGEFRSVNVGGTLGLARQAAEAGVQRFLFVSSIKVNGEATQPGRPFQADDAPAPLDPYGISKWEAEHELKALGEESGMEIVIVRPSLIYGPGVKANFESMMRWLAKGVPLPLGAVRHNRRTLLALDNLVDLLSSCLDHPAAANEVFLAGDDEDVSTATLLERLAQAMSRPARLLPVPVWMLEAGGAVLGKKDVVRRLCGSLQVDIRKSREMLGWSPPIGLDQALRKTAAHFMQHRVQ
jgi:nucleoside-diphosphate-sugar epimerase